MRAGLTAMKKLVDTSLKGEAICTETNKKYWFDSFKDQQRKYGKPLHKDEVNVESDVLSNELRD